MKPDQASMKNTCFWPISTISFCAPMPNIPSFLMLHNMSLHHRNRSRRHQLPGHTHISKSSSLKNRIDTGIRTLTKPFSCITNNAVLRAAHRPRTTVVKPQAHSRLHPKKALDSIKVFLVDCPLSLRARAPCRFGCPIEISFRPQRRDHEQSDRRNPNRVREAHACRREGNDLPRRSVEAIQRRTLVLRVFQLQLQLMHEEWNPARESSTSSSTS